MWSEWSKAVIYSTKTSEENSLISEGGASAQPFTFRPVDTDLPQAIDVDVREVSRESLRESAGTSWSEILDRCTGKLNILNLTLISKLSMCLKEYDLRVNQSVNISEREDDNREDMECEIEVSASPLQLSVDSDIHASPHSAQHPVPRARTKADLRLGGLRLVSTPKELNVCRPPSPICREAKRVRLNVEGPKASLDDACVSLAVVSDASELRGSSRIENEGDARERKLLSLKLAARLQRLQGRPRDEWLDVDHDATRYSPSPPSTAQSQADGQACSLPEAVAAGSPSDRPSGSDRRRRYEGDRTVPTATSTSKPRQSDKKSGDAKLQKGIILDS